MFWALVYLFSSCVELCANCSLEINLRSFKQDLHPESSLLHVEPTRLSRNDPCLPQQNKLCMQISYEQVLSISEVQKTGLNTKPGIHCQNTLTLAPECTHMVYPLKCAAPTCCQLRKDRRSHMPTTCWIIQKFLVQISLGCSLVTSIPIEPCNWVASRDFYTLIHD